MTQTRTHVPCLALESGGLVVLPTELSGVAHEQNCYWYYVQQAGFPIVISLPLKPSIISIYSAVGKEKMRGLRPVPSPLKLMVRP